MEKNYSNHNYPTYFYSNTKLAFVSYMNNALPAVKAGRPLNGSSRRPGVEREVLVFGQLAVLAEQPALAESVLKHLGNLETLIINEKVVFTFCLF